MRDYFDIAESELNEILIDAEAFYQKVEDEKPCTSDYGNKYGVCGVSSEKKGHIYISHFKMYFNRNIRAFTESYPPIIGLYFNKKGHCHQKIHRREKEFHKFGNQECGFYFMNGESFGESLYQENLPIEFVGFNFLPDFFQSLTERYPEMLASYYKRFERGESFALTPQTIPISLPMQQVLNQIDQAFLLGNSSTMYLEAKVLELMALQLQCVHHSTFAHKNSCIKTPTDKDKIYEAKSVLLSNLSDTPSLRELSLQVGINEKKLKQGFKEVFGTTVYGVLYQHKMQLARQYLLDTSLSIGEVALHCGYEYPSHFSTAFKRYWGVAPKEVREGEFGIK